MAKDWHSSEEIQKLFEDFHDDYAYFPAEKIADVQDQHERIMEELRYKLRNSWVDVSFEYTGSTYEGIKVASTPMEFDVMVVLSSEEDNITAIKTWPGWAKLTASGNGHSFEKFRKHSSDYLHTDKASRYFFGVLQKAINQDLKMRETILLRAHGPAVQMDVYSDKDHSSLIYSVDMVPSFLVGGGWFSSAQYYVAKSFKGDVDGYASFQPTESWRKSFSLQEKELINDVDGCHKKCIRIFKVLRDSEPGLHGINSYIIKTAVLSVNRDKPWLSWDEDELAERFINILQFLAKCIAVGIMPHYFLPDVNLLDRFTEYHMQNMSTRLDELIRSENQLKKALSRASSRADFVMESQNIPKGRDKSDGSVFWNVLGGIAVGMMALFISAKKD